MKETRKKLLALILTVMVAMTCAVPAFADDAADGGKAAEETAVQTEKETQPKAEEPKAEQPKQEAAPAEEEVNEAAEEATQATEAAQAKAGAGADKNSDKGKSGEKSQADAARKSGSALRDDGTYAPDGFTFTGGTGKAKMNCEKVVRKNGRLYAFITVTSDNMTHIYMGKATSNRETPSLYDPVTDSCGKDVYPISNREVIVPAEENKDVSCALRTTAMSEPHWVNYSFHIKMTDQSKKISDSTDLPQNVTPAPADPSDPTDPTDPTGQTDPTDPTGQTDPTDPTQPGNEADPTSPADPTDPADTRKLGVGTWKVKATTSRQMFYLYPKEKDPAWTILKVKKNGSMTATITLTGDGYDYVYMGTPAQAKKAGKSSWIKAKVKKGYYSFTIPVSALDKKLTITPHSRKYEKDGDITTDPWRPDKWIIFYSGGAKKTSDRASIETGKRSDDSSGSSGGSQSGSKNDNKADKESKWKDDSSKSTSAVNNSTSLKDGVYAPDRFSWSGGSGRLAYIRCNKITVKGGKAYATIEFSSGKYDSLKANGRVYSKQGGGNSVFVIPVKLNANNTIIGRTTAMSQPHWVKYTIFIYKAGATAGKSGAAAAGTDGHVTNTKKLSDQAPDLLGLKAEGKVEVEHAAFFKIYKYEKGITLIEVDQATDTALYKQEDAADQGETAEGEDPDAGADDTQSQTTGAQTTGAAGTDRQDADAYPEPANAPGAFPSDVLVNASGTGLVTSDILAGADGSVTAVLTGKVRTAADRAKAGQAGSAQLVDLAAEADAVDATAQEAAEADASQAEGTQDQGEAKVEYDEEGKPIAKTENEVTAELYENNVINYLVVPKDTELPAGLEKDCVIIEQPVDKAFIASEDMLTEMEQLDQTGAIDSIGMKATAIRSKAVKKAVKDGDITAMDSYEKPDYRHLIKAKTDLAVLPETALPEKVGEDAAVEQKTLAEQKTEKLRTLQSRFATLSIPVMVNRAMDEKDTYARAEWIKVCGAIFGETEKAVQIFDQYVKENEKETLDR